MEMAGEWRGHVLMIHQLLPVKNKQIIMERCNELSILSYNLYIILNTRLHEKYF